MSGKVFNTYQITANSTPQLVGLGSGNNSVDSFGMQYSNRRNRKLIMRNISANNAYYGNSTVNSTSGAVLLNSTTAVPETHIETSANVYVVVASGTSVVTVAEVCG